MIEFVYVSIAQKRFSADELEVILSLSRKKQSSRNHGAVFIRWI
jgi:hypothetical protein